MKKASNLFLVLALILSHAMCAVVAYHFCNMQWCVQYGGCSAPEWTAILTGIPFGIGIAVCIATAVILRKKDAGRA